MATKVIPLEEGTTMVVHREAGRLKLWVYTGEDAERIDRREKPRQDESDNSDAEA